MTAEATLQRVVRSTYGLQAVAFAIGAMAAYCMVRCSLGRCHGFAILDAIGLAISYHTFNLATDPRDSCQLGKTRT
jgi:hypothetical protein